MKGSHNPGKEFAGEVSLKHIFEIAKIKRSVNYLNFLWKYFRTGKADFLELERIGRAALWSLAGGNYEVRRRHCTERWYQSCPIVSAMILEIICHSSHKSQTVS